MKYQFLDGESKKLYRLLGFNEVDMAECRCLYVDKNVPKDKKCLSRELIKSEHEFIKWAKQWNGYMGEYGTVNCYVGGNPRNEQKQVSKAWSVSVDIDPVGYDKTTGASQEQMEVVLDAGRSLIKSFTGGSLALSGNGCLVVWTTRNPVTTDLEMFSKKVALFQEECRQLIKSFKGVRIDATHDNARLLKLIGTVSTKGLVRASRFVELCSGAGDGEHIFDYVRSLEQKKSNAPGEFLAKPNTTSRGALSDAVITDSQKTSDGYDDCLNTSVIQEAVKSLNSLSDGRLDIYDQWLKVGMALRELGSIGLVLWDKWSQRNKEKYNAKACSEKWGTFFDGRPAEDKISLKSLIAWAKEDGLARHEIKDNYGLVNNNHVVLHSPDTSIDEYREHLKKRGDHETPELPIGFSKLDEATWGLKRGDIYTIGALRGNGKTSLCLNIVINLCRSGKRVLYLSTEMSHHNIFDRIFSIGAMIDGKEMLRGRLSDENQQKFDVFTKEFKSYKLHLNDSFLPDISRVEAAVEQVKPDVLIFDHIQHISAKSKSRYEAVSDFVRGLKDMSLKHDVAVLIASQLTRPQRIMNFKTQQQVLAKPTVQDFKESGVIEEESAFCVLLYESGEFLDDGVPIITADLVKNRYGPCTIVDLAFYKKYTQFKEIGG